MAFATPLVQIWWGQEDYDLWRHAVDVAPDGWDYTVACGPCGGGQHGAVCTFGKKKGGVPWTIVFFSWRDSNNYHGVCKENDLFDMKPNKLTDYYMFARKLSEPLV